MFKLNTLIIFTISSLLGAAVGQILEAGQCNLNIPLVANFNIQNFAGTWYEIQRSDSPEQNTECAAFTFTQANNIINVQHNGVNDNFAQGTTGTATLATGTAQITLNISNWFTGAIDFWVLATDYQSYAVTYACENVSAVQRRIYLWVLGRQRTYASVIEQNLIATTISNLLNIELSTLKTVDHSDTACYTLPEIPAGQAIVIPGQCDANIPVQQNFNVAAFTGTWHQIANYYTESSVGNCARAQYTAADSVVNILNSEVINQQLLTMTGTATVSSTDNSARLSVILNLPSGQNARDLYVISTDYTNYAISYSCENVSATQKRIYSWILSRTRQLSAAVQASVDQVVGSVSELNYRYYTNTDQSDAACFYLPEPTGQPVQFPGQCDTNIAPMANFNAAQYLGLWYDVESYPAPFQTGTCSLAEYSLNADNTVRVENSQVTNQALETWIGSAVLATDGTGSLGVTFIVNGQAVTSTLWVLATDYTSYSYVYSCQNVGQDARLVFSWKLSRTPELTAAANTAINAFINTINVFDQRYYVARGHTETDCLGGNVILTGQCTADNQVLAVTNFNASTFAGTWYEISRFPSSFEQGDCVSYQFTLTGANTFSLTQNAVSNEALISTSSLATASADGRGVLSVTISGVPFNSIYILATDYTDYALAYACRNVNAQNKQVYSWKLSKSAWGLSQNANTDINQIINTNADLSENNYKTTNRDNDACFYYPVFDQLPSTIELPGPCPTNIRGVANFNAGNYLGSWYETARYPAADQSGQCSRAEYSAGDRVIVYNTEVVNQQLQTQSGFAYVASTDGSGVLVVEFEVNGVVGHTDYYILATDYTSYSLVYSCTDLQNGNRRVASWKLSRTPTLSAAAATAIAPVVASTQGLSENYYLTTSQTAEACFYIPTFIGTWYEIQRSDSPQQNTDCAAFDITVSSNTINVNHRGVNDNFQEDSSGTASLSSGLAKLVLEITMFGNLYLWILSREKSLTNELITAHISAILDSLLGIDVNGLKSINHSDTACYMLPVFEPGETIIIPGQCDPNIQVEQNFNLYKYTGLWYNIEAYPAPLQSGSCTKTHYSLNDNDSLVLENIQVVNHLLDINIGSAIIATDDESAKLNITFNIDDTYVTSNYWVLATDYDSYALVYSCANIDADFKSVFSWKLSRTPNLTEAANAAINSVINSIPVLHQRYYKTNSHTDDDCFYYPDNEDGDVLLPGQCLDIDEVPAATNFDATLFTGTCYEIARFPSDIQQGECVATEYNISDPLAFTITRTSVKDERQIRTSIQGIISSGSAVISTSRAPFDNIFILATDYSEYTLAYSCRNINGQTKQIYSWKLSRYRSGLSADANAVINGIVDSYIELWEGYYRPTTQDNDACFHYPVFEQAPLYVELPGPCPDSIQGVPNFNINAYMGRWYEVARYPNTEQVGQCGRVEFSQSEQMNISNTEVADLALLTQRGVASASANGSGQIDIDFIANGEIRSVSYFILATDYRSYSLVYSCVNTTDNGNSRVSSWQLSRTPTLSNQAAAAMVPAIVNTRGLTEEYYQLISQTEEDCFYIPPVNEDQAPIFRGQCENITGIKDFDAQRFVGYWFGIEAYPIDNSGGECRSSEYIKDGDTYSVVETQVQNNEGTILAGNVTLSSDGKLHITMSDKSDQDIWILTTDYDTYALLYSCQNINDEYISVWSAKHSRSRSLTEAANNAMSPVIANYRVLHDQFYLSVNQSDSACFYYPTITDDEIIIPGQCDLEIPVVQNFNISTFAGTWFQIERYDEVGESSCLGSRFTIGESSVNISFLNFEVRNEELATVEGSATIVSVDGSAKIKIILDDSEGGITTMEVSILATDYRSYALAYTCTNINAFQRQVRAWKLSRTRSLSTAGTIIINNLIRQRQELHQPYFKQVEQDERCPEPSSAVIEKSNIILLFMCVFLQW